MADILYSGPRSSIGAILGFTVIREQHDRTGMLTKHPIETGGKIADHITIDPDTVTLEIIVTDTPISADAGDVSAAFMADVVEDDDGTVTGTGVTARPGYSIAISDQLRQLMADRVVMTVVTTARTYQNMALVSMSDPVDVEMGVNAKRLTLRFEQATFVTSKVISSKKTSDPRGKSKRRTGLKVSDLSQFQYDNMLSDALGQADAAASPTGPKVFKPRLDRL